MTDHKTVREAWEIVKGVVKSLERQAEWTKEEIHNNEPVAEAFAILESVINSDASNGVKDLLDYYAALWRQASGVCVERDRKIRFAIAALDRLEAQPAEDDVREAVEFWKDDIAEIKRLGLFTEGCTHIETLIRAATAPKYTEKQWLNLFKTVFAIIWTPEQALEHIKEDVSVCVTTVPKTTDAERVNLKDLLDEITPENKHDFIDLRAPAAMPQEVVEKLNKAVEMCDQHYSTSAKRLIEEALALLKQKEQKDD